MLHNLTLKQDIRTFSLSAENINGEKGKGGMAEVGSASEAARDLGRGWKVNPYVVIKPNENYKIAEIFGQGAIKHIWMVDSSPEARGTILRIYFDGQEKPSVCVPLYDFFCNANHLEYAQINSLPITYNPRRGMNCYFEMPYRTSFKIEAQNLGREDIMLYYQIDCEEKRVEENALYFHAHFNRTNPLPYMESYTILDKITGNGAYVGTYMHWGVKSNGWWGEGEIKFFIDGDGEFPSICGTGTEDYFGGAYNFEVDGEYIPFSTNYQGLTKTGNTDKTYNCQKYFDMYRFHITDPVYFKEDLRVTIQALGWRTGARYLPLQDDISSVSYWYSDSLEGEDFKLSKDELEII